MSSDTPTEPSPLAAPARQGQISIATPAQHLAASKVPSVPKKSSTAATMSTPTRPGRISSELERKQETPSSKSSGGYKGVPVTEQQDNDDAVEPLQVTTEDGITWTKGQVQEPAYRDKYFAIAFLIHFGVILSTAILFGNEGVQALSSSDDGPTRRFLESWNIGEGEYNRAEQEYGYSGDDYYQQDNSNKNNTDINTVSVVAVLLSCVVLPPALSILSLRVMKENAEFLIHCSLYLAVAMNLFFCIVGILTGLIGLAIFGGVFALILVLYSRRVWHRIPYAAANVKAASTAVQANLGMTLLTFSTLFVNVGWFIMWMIALFGTLQTDWMKNQVHDEEVYEDGQLQDEETISPIGIFVILLFVLSYHWTLQVIKGVVHTTIAGTIGTWIYTTSEASSFCSNGLMESLGRSLTYSFGSICFGSLIVALIETARSALRNQRGRRNLLGCIAECLLACIESIAEYFNKWAFIFVGLYGYSFVEAGHNTMNLFRARGWSVIISDNLVVRMLAFVCLGIGVLQALLSILIAFVTGSTDGGTIGISAGLGFLFGFLFSSLMMTVMTSSVDTVIVCFAESPREFQANHPELYEVMALTWTSAWPDVFVGTIAIAEAV